MSNYPVNPDLATFSDVVYDETAVLSAFGKNFTLDQLQPVKNASIQRSFTYCHNSLAAYPYGRWNNEVVYGLQSTEYGLAYSNFIAFYLGVLIPLGYPMLVINNVVWNVNTIQSSGNVYPDITFNFLVFEPIP